MSTTVREGQPSPFSPRVVLALVLAGTLAFVMTLYFIGAGETNRGINDGGNHAGGMGLNGFAGVAELLERQGWDVARSRSEAGLQSEGVLVLTPPQNIDADDLDQIVSDRRYAGPTVVILPKWMSAPVRKGTVGARKGWVQLGDEPVAPEWPGFADEVVLSEGKAKTWEYGDLRGGFPVPTHIQSARPHEQLVPIVTTSDRKRVLAACYVSPEMLGGAVGDGYEDEDDNTVPYRVLMVFEPDLLDNYGLARIENAELAARLFDDADEDRTRRITFDMTMNGLGRTPNLLTLAFTPPFLAATLCLLLLALIVGWRAFGRFGPPLAEARRIAFGKRQLVANSAGLLQRAGRIHLLGTPYATMMRTRIARLLGLRRQGSQAETDHAIDRMLAARGMDGGAFSLRAARLSAARRPHDLLRAAQALQDIERTLER